MTDPTPDADAAPTRADVSPEMMKVIRAARAAQVAAYDRGEDEVAARAAADEVLRAGGFAPRPRRGPVPVSRARADGWTPATQRAFVAALAETGCVSRAASAAGVSRSTAYALRTREPHSIFALAWDVAIRIGRKRLLDVAMERALAGQEVPVWHRGEQIGTRTVYNDRLLAFLLSHRPEPAHPVLEPAQIEAMFPQLMAVIDEYQPHPCAEIAADMGLTAWKPH